MPRPLDKGVSADVYLHHNSHRTVHRARVINNGTKFFVSPLRIVIIVFQQSFKHLSTMNRTHLEGAAEALAAQQGYAFHTGPEDGMAHTVRSYPAAWLAPLELHAVEGRGHGRATYDMTLHLLSSGAFARRTGSRRRGAFGPPPRLRTHAARRNLADRRRAHRNLLLIRSAPPLAATPPRPGSGHGTVRTRESRKRRRGASPP